MPGTQQQGQPASWPREVDSELPGPLASSLNRFRAGASAEFTVIFCHWQSVCTWGSKDSGPGAVI